MPSALLAATMTSALRLKRYREAAPAEAGRGAEVGVARNRFTTKLTPASTTGEENLKGLKAARNQRLQAVEAGAGVLARYRVVEEAVALSEEEEGQRRQLWVFGRGGCRGRNGLNCPCIAITVRGAIARMTDSAASADGNDNDAAYDYVTCDNNYVTASTRRCP